MTEEIHKIRFDFVDKTTTKSLDRIAADLNKTAINARPINVNLIAPTSTKAGYWSTVVEQASMGFAYSGMRGGVRGKPAAAKPNFKGNVKLRSGEIRAGIEKNIKIKQPNFKLKQPPPRQRIISPRQTKIKLRKSEPHVQNVQKSRRMEPIIRRLREGRSIQEIKTQTGTGTGTTGSRIGKIKEIVRLKNKQNVTTNKLEKAKIQKEINSKLDELNPKLENLKKSGGVH